MAQGSIGFDDANGYERFMGRWSRAVAGRFLRWIEPAARRQLAGCRLRDRDPDRSRARPVRTGVGHRHRPGRGANRARIQGPGRHPGDVPAGRCHDAALCRSRLRHYRLGACHQLHPEPVAGAHGNGACHGDRRPAGRLCVGFRPGPVAKRTVASGNAHVGRGRSGRAWHSALQRGGAAVLIRSMPDWTPSSRRPSMSRSRIPTWTISGPPRRRATAPPRRSSTP